jgi:lysozyme family protein
MNGNFSKSFEYVLDDEGGFSDNKKDPGGATNRGVTLRTWEDWQRRQVSVQEIRDLTVDQVLPLYRARYWDAVKADLLPNGVDYLVFDTAVNCGVSNAIKFIQQSLGVKDDGVIGPVTLTAIRTVDVDHLIDQYTQLRQKHYESLPTFDEFGEGWMDRAKRVAERAIELS